MIESYVRSLNFLIVVNVQPSGLPVDLVKNFFPFKKAVLSNS